MIIFFRKHIWAVLLILGLVGVVGAYVYTKNTQTSVTPSYAIIETVGKGSVSSGIQATGKIVAAQKLDLDVYKQTQRIDAVNVVNGGHVKAGDVLLSFDKSSAYVDAESAQVKLAGAQLDLNTQREQSTNPNTTMRTLESDVSQLQTAIEQDEKSIAQAYRDYLNANLTAESGNIGTIDRVKPTISGLYTGTQEGEYHITVYGSSADSGYSFRVTGLETDVQSVYVNTSVALGKRGLRISFPSNVQNGDQWTVPLPNTHAPEYVENKEAYEKSVTNLTESISSAQLSIANKTQQIEDLKLTDSSSYRDLNVSKAEATLSEARVQLSKNYDVIHEQDIVAPFSGTIDGLANVVVGATPTRDTNDSISLGTLISDEFLVTFSLSATDVSKIEIGQKVLVSITSFPAAGAIEAFVTEISSLPDSSDVAQYTVKAQIKPTADIGIALREGLLADVEIVQKEVTDVVRVPLSAISYENGKATVEVLGSLTPEQQKQVDTLNVLQSDTGTFPSYPVTITTGVSGLFYVEITGGLELGTKIVVSKTEQDVQVLQQQQFGPGGGESARTQGARTATPSGAAAQQK